MNITIKEGKPSDISFLPQLNYDAMVRNPEFDSYFVKDWSFSKAAQNYFSQLLKDTNQLCLIAYNDKQPIGYLGACIQKVSYRKGKYVEIDNIAILPQYQRQGIGKQMLKKCKKWAKQKNIGRVFLNSYSKNLPAINFYKKMGFKELGVELEMEV